MLRCGDPEADEDEWRRYLGPEGGEVGCGHVVLVGRKRAPSRPSRKDEAASFDGARVAERDGLEVPLGAGGVQTEPGEVLRDVAGRRIVAGRSGPAAGQPVAGEVADVLLQAGGAHLGDVPAGVRIAIPACGCHEQQDQQAARYLHMLLSERW